MPTLSGDITSEGALVEVLLGWSMPDVQTLRRAGRPIPQPLSVRALLDTGAETTGADNSLVLQLALPRSRFVLTNLPAHGGVGAAFLHAASLTVVHPSGNPRDNLFARELDVLGIPLAALGYQAVIGRDVLDGRRFIYAGPTGRFRLSY